MQLQHGVNISRPAAAQKCKSAQGRKKEMKKERERGKKSRKNP